MSQKGLSAQLSKKVFSVFSLAFIALLPLLFLPIFNNFIFQTKQLLIIVSLLVTLALFFFKSFKQKHWSVVFSPLTVGLASFSLMALLSSLLTQTYPVENLLGMGSIYLAFGLIALFGSSLLSQTVFKQNFFELLIKVLSIVAAILSISSLLELVGFGPSKLIQLLTGFELGSSLLINLAGSPMVAAQIILLALIGVIGQVLTNKKIEILHTITIPILVFGLGLHIWAMLPGKEAQPAILPFSASWSVMLDSLRSPRTALIGQGPEAFADVYRRFKPSWINGQPFWQMNFGAGTNFPLTIIVQLGILGLLAWLTLILSFVRKMLQQKQIKQAPLSWMILVSFILQLLLPTNLVMLGLQAILLASWIAQFRSEFADLKLRALSAAVIKQSQKSQKKLKLSKKQAKKTNAVLSNIFNGLGLAGVIFLAFLTSKAYGAYYHIFQANKALASNDAVRVYEHQRQAVALNPYLDNLRRSYALTNLQIALALSNKADATQQEKAQVSQLVQQAVRESKAAITLNPSNSANWQALASIYQELIGSAEGAENWTTTAYVEAIKTDPTNPLLRIQLGSLLLNQEQNEQAISVLTQAANLKPDLPTSYFHLGLAFERTKQFAQALQVMQQALLLLPAESEDKEIVQEHLDQLETLVQEASKSGQLQQPAQPGQAAQPGQPAQPTQEQLQERPTPLGEELPSITDQELEDANNQDLTPANEPLELSEEDAAAVNEEAELAPENSDADAQQDADPQQETETDQAEQANQPDQEALQEEGE